MAHVARNMTSLIPQVILERDGKDGNQIDG